MSKTNKFIVWCVLVAVTSFWMWAGVQVWLRGSLFQIHSILNIAITSILFVVLLALLSVGIIIFQNRLWSTYLGIIVGVTYSILFKISNLNLVGMFILVMLFYYAQDVVHREMRERLKLNSQAFIRKGLTNFIVAFFILASFAAYQSPAIESFKNIEQLPSSGTSFIRGVVEKTVEAQIGDSATKEQKASAADQVTKEIVAKANEFFGPYFQYAPPVLAFGLFLVLWGVGWIFNLLALPLGMLIFYVLKKTNFFRIEERDVRAESIII